jgi:twitching motility protein PilT
VLPASRCCKFAVTRPHLGFVATDKTPRRKDHQRNIAGLLAASGRGSDLIISPGHPPHVKLHGKIVPVCVPGIESFSIEETARIATDIIGTNKFAQHKLKEEGSCDVSYSVPGVARLRVNIFSQRDTHAIVMRMVPTEIPNLVSMNLPAQFLEIAELRNGVVLVTGATGSGKSSTLAALLDYIKCAEVLPHSRH